MSDTKKILILQNTVCGAKRVHEGDIVEASPADTRLLIALKKAREATPEDLKEAAKDAKTDEGGKGGKGGDGGKADESGKGGKGGE